jgi:hypothetical protein
MTYHCSRLVRHLADGQQRSQQDGIDGVLVDAGRLENDVLNRSRQRDHLQAVHTQCAELGMRWSWLPSGSETWLFAAALPQWSGMQADTRDCTHMCAQI